MTSTINNGHVPHEMEIIHHPAPSLDTCRWTTERKEQEDFRVNQLPLTFLLHLSENYAPSQDKPNHTTSPKPGVSTRVGFPHGFRGELGSKIGRLKLLNIDLLADLA